MRVLHGEVGNCPDDWTDVLTVNFNPRSGWNDIGASKSGLYLFDGFGEISLAEIHSMRYRYLRDLEKWEEVSLVFLWQEKTPELSIGGLFLDNVHRIRMVNNPRAEQLGECATSPIRFFFQEVRELESCAQVPLEKVYA